VETVDPAVRELRRVIRDLVALATMPAGWVGREPPQIAESVADLLLHTLRAEAVYVCLQPDSRLPTPIESVRSRAYPEFVEQIREMRSHSAATNALLVDSLQESGRPAPLRVAVYPIGIAGEGGFVGVGCGSPTFPTETESLLLSVAANQAAVALQSSRLLEARRQSEQALRDSNKKITQLLESISDGFVAFDHEWRITYVNDRGAEFLQRSREELIGENLWLKYPEIIGTTFEREYRAAVQEGKPHHFEEFYPPLESWFELHLYPGPEGLSVFFRNINDRKKAEAALLKAEKLAITGKLAATIAHEINNPLESVINLLYLARNSAPEGTRTQYYLQTAEQEINRVAHIARQTLGFYRDSTLPVPVHLSDLLEDVLSVYRSRLESRSIQVRQELVARQPVVALKGELHQVFSNLLANAIDAMERGGILRMWTEETNGAATSGVRIVIADTGPGILPQNLPKIFEPFFTTKKAVGTGLGLWVVRQIVENHGGAVEIQSNTAPENHGTAVSVFLPFASAKLPQPQSLATTAPVM